MIIKETYLLFKNQLSNRVITQKIVLHHADASTCDADTIHKWHLANGWAGIGYHFVVRKNGTIERGRPIDKVGSHCQNNNSDSIGVCFEGNFEKETMGDTQIQAGQELMSYLYQIYNLDASKVKRHKDLMATSCPGANFPFGEIIKGVVTPQPAPKSKVSKARVKRFLNTRYKKQIKEVLKKDAVKVLNKRLFAIAFETELKKLGADIEIDGIFDQKDQKAFNKYSGYLKKGSKGIFIKLWKCLLVWKGYEMSNISKLAGAQFVTESNKFFGTINKKKDSIVHGSDVRKALK